MNKKLKVVDLFAGAGGTSTGASLAAQELDRDIDLTAINHWNIAVETHALNHPETRHICMSLDQVTPTKVVTGGRLDLLVASPECTHHSLARGGKPMNDQSRASAWLILKWLSDLYVDNVLIENVEEFINWGPLGANGRPLESRKGELFRQFIASMQALGYKLEYRTLCAADYGAATVRERLFILGRRGRRQVTWPARTHAPASQTDTLFGKLKPWRPAREIIDWSIKGESIFTRKKPLARSTLERIYAGMKKFKWPEPFLVVLRNHMDGRSLDEPLPTITAGGSHIGLVEPFYYSMEHSGRKKPFLVPVNHGKDTRSYSFDRPMPTITTVDAWAMVEPFMVQAGGPKGCARQPRSVNEPMRTILTENHTAVIEPFVMSYYGTTNVSPVSAPLPTVTTKDRFALVTPDGFQIDILFRMLQPHELAAAMSFPRNYRFAGTREQQVKQIGNAVDVRQARALCRELAA